MNLKSLFACVALIAAPWCGWAASEPVLWYDQPAKTWMTQALPIGNGRMGAMVFGGTGTERIQFNEISLWTGDDKDTGAYQAFGDLFIELGHTTPEQYRRELDLRDAVHRVSYRVGDVEYRREYFCSAPDQVMVFRFTASKPGAYSGVIRLAGTHKETMQAQANQLSFASALTNGLVYETQVRVLTNGGEWTVKDGALACKGATSFTILLAAGTAYVPDYDKGWRGAHPHEAVMRQIETAAHKTYAQLLADHTADYQKLFNRVVLDVGQTTPAVANVDTERRLIAYGKGGLDPDLEELLFQYGRYLLISSSRPGSLPANLQGLWNDSNNPPWRSDYHSNINIEMNYWPAEVANLAECHQPFLDYINNQRAVRSKATQEYYKCKRGWTVQTENNIYGGASWNWNPPGSAWYAQHVWEHYAFGDDTNYLKNFAYPILKEVCEFWEDRLVTLPDGSLVTPDGWSPEHGPHEAGVTYDQEIVWDLFTNYIEASTELGMDADYRTKVMAMREKLVKPRIGKWGQLQEWMADIDDPKDTHRHVSHLFALHPGRQISPMATPELAAAAKKSLEARGDLSTGWAMAWRINFWARLLDGDHAYRLLRNLMKIVGGTGTDYGTGGGVYANLFDAHPPFQIDGNFGATAGMAEMLIQSHNRNAGMREIHLLPALPTTWPTGSVKGLRARGGVEVAMEWKDGQLTKAHLRSPLGGTFQVRLNKDVVKVEIKPGATVTLDSKLNTVR